MPGEDLVQPGQGLRVEGDVHGAQCGVELVLGPRADDRGGHGGLGQQPGEADVSGFMTQLVGQILVLLDLSPVLVERLQ